MNLGSWRAVSILISFTTLYIVCFKVLLLYLNLTEFDFNSCRQCLMTSCWSSAWYGPVSPNHVPHSNSTLLMRALIFAAQVLALITPLLLTSFGV